MSNRKVMQQALEALLWADAQGENWQQVVKKAIKPIQEAAAQPEPVQEPFGYLWPTGSHPEFRFTQQKRDGADGMPLYTAPLQQQAEPVASIYVSLDGAREFDDWKHELPVGRNFLFTAALQRKPLTDAEFCEQWLKQTGRIMGTDKQLLLQAKQVTEVAHGIKEPKP